MKSRLVALTVTVILYINLSSSLAASSKAVALVNGDTIYLQEAEEQIKKTPPLPTDSVDPQMFKSQILNGLIVDKLLSQKAAHYDFKDDSLFKKEKEEHITNFVFRFMYDRYVTGTVKIDPVDIDVHYYSNKEKTYKIPEQVKVSHILIEPVEDAQILDGKTRAKKADEEAKKKIAELKKKAQKEDFATLAKTFSQDNSTNHRGGDLGPQKRGELLPEFDTAAFRAKVGDVLGPYKSQYGYHIVKIFDHLQEGYRELNDELRKEIEQKLKMEKERVRNQEFLDSLRNLASYTFNDRVLSLPDTARPDDTSWIVIVNRKDTILTKDGWGELWQYMQFTKTGNLTLGDKKDFFRAKSLWTQLKVLRDAATNLGLFKREEVKQEERKFALERAKDRLRKKSTADFSPQPEEIRRYYDAHPELYAVEHPLHVYHIIFDDSITASAVRDSLLLGADFAIMAEKHYPGQTEIREVAYDLGYIAPYEMPEGFYTAADRLIVDEVSPPIKTYLGYHLIKLIDRQKDKTLDEVTPQVLRLLREEFKRKAQATWEVELKKGAKIKIFGNVLDQLKLSQTVSP